MVATARSAVRSPISWCSRPRQPRSYPGARSSNAARSRYGGTRSVSHRRARPGEGYRPGAPGGPTGPGAPGPPVSSSGGSGSVWRSSSGLHGGRQLRQLRGSWGAGQAAPRPEAGGEPKAAQDFLWGARVVAPIASRGPRGRIRCRRGVRRSRRRPDASVRGWCVPEFRAAHRPRRGNGCRPDPSWSRAAGPGRRRSHPARR